VPSLDVAWTRVPLQLGGHGSAAKCGVPTLVKLLLNRIFSLLAHLRKSNVLGAVLAIVSALALFRLNVFVLTVKGYVHFVDISFGVTTGHPFWKVFQSRLLSPYIIKALSLGSTAWYVTAHIWFHIGTVTIAGFLSWRLGRKYGGSDQSALLALTTFFMSFAFLLSPQGICSWDFLDVVILLVFIDLVLSSASLPWFIGLFAIAIWNRDTANYIALWLILDSLVRYYYQPKRSVDWGRISAGIICIAVGLVLAELLKRNLLIEEMGPIVAPNSPISSGNSYNFVPLTNLNNLKDSLTIFSYEFNQLILVLYATVFALGLKLVRLDPQRYLSLSLIVLALLISLFCFAWYFETRIYIVLVPFIVISVVIVSRPDSPYRDSLTRSL
jgi:hypothetical protein